MADTRCADPELQLDVDVMILEYTLYHAIKAQFGLLSSGCQDATQATESTRLLTIFDCFIHHFNQHHPTHPKSSEFYSNLDVLEFLVLLSNRSTNLMASAFGNDTPEKMCLVSAENLASRRRWLVARERYARRLSKQPASSKDNVLQDVEDQIYKAWNQDHQQQGLTHQHQQVLSQSPSPSLFDLLPRFIQISAEMSATLNLPPNETWMHIAGEFMLQAGLEALLDRSHPPSSDTATAATATTTTNNNNHNITPRLDDCFAWGYVDPHQLIPDGAELSSLDKQTQLVNDLFSDPDSMMSSEDGADSTDPVTGLGLGEDPEWTQTRSQWLSEFSIATDASSQSQSCRLDRLSVKFPLEEFQTKLTTFMQSVWDLFCKDLNGKPVLAQIEEGHIKSLGIEGPAFEEFLDHVGLKKRKSSSPEGGGILTFDIPELPKTGEESSSDLRHRLLPSLEHPPDGISIRGNAWSGASNRNKNKTNTKKRTRNMI